MWRKLSPSSFGRLEKVGKLLSGAGKPFTGVESLATLRSGSYLPAQRRTHRHYPREKKSSGEHAGVRCGLCEVGDCESHIESEKRNDWKQKSRPCPSHWPEQHEREVNRKPDFGEPRALTHPLY